MTINRFRIYVGPLGNLRPLPRHKQDESPRFSFTRPGAAHVSLDGRTTIDMAGRTRRSWDLAWDWITEDDETWIQGLMRRAASAELRLMDPRKRNLAPEDVSGGGSATGSTGAFTKTGSATLAWTAGTVPTDLDGLVAGRLVWTGVVNTDTLYGTTERLPVLSGSTYRVSAYVKTTTTFRFSARPFNTAGAEQTTVTDATNNASTAGVWTRLSWLYTPAAGIASAYLGVTATGSGNIETTGWSFQVDESLKSWSYGYGCPAVVIPPVAQGGYWRNKYHKIQLAIVEV